MRVLGVLSIFVILISQAAQGEVPHFVKFHDLTTLPMDDPVVEMGVGATYSYRVFAVNNVLGLSYRARPLVLEEDHVALGAFLEKMVGEVLFGLTLSFKTLSTRQHAEILVLIIDDVTGLNPKGIQQQDPQLEHLKAVVEQLQQTLLGLTPNTRVFLRWGHLTPGTDETREMQEMSWRDLQCQIGLSAA